MSNYADMLNTPVPQSKPLPGQVPNNAGGFVYALDKWSRLDRFLVLGSDANTHYQKAKDLTVENARCVLECMAEDAPRLVKRIVEISKSGRAPKNDPAIFALALVCCDKSDARLLGYAAISDVCRTGTHIFSFVSTCRKLGKGFGRGFKRAIADWYNKKSVEDLAYQAVKYRNRDGWTHERLLDLSHPKGDKSPEREALHAWMVGKVAPEREQDLPTIVQVHQQLMALDGKPRLVADLIALNPKVPWEALPTSVLTSSEVLSVLLPNMPLGALLRNLANMTRAGVLKPLSAELRTAVERLTNEVTIKKSRLHPFNILNALATYSSGRGFRGQNSWTPEPNINEALNRAFYKAFTNVSPTGKRIMLALDISGSMAGAALMNSKLSAREASSAMALVTAAVEPQTMFVGFTSTGRGFRGNGLEGISPLQINPSWTLEQTIEYTGRLGFSGTDCALPMLYAEANQLEVDAFIIYTDNETWHGQIHPSEALRRYRKASGIADSKLIVVGMTSTGFSIADPADAGMMDFVGFDSAAPALIADFIRGEAEPTTYSTERREYYDPQFDEGVE